MKNKVKFSLLFIFIILLILGFSLFNEKDYFDNILRVNAEECDHTLPDYIDLLNDKNNDYITVESNNYTIHCKCGSEVYLTGSITNTFLSDDRSDCDYDTYWYVGDSAYEYLSENGRLTYSAQNSHSVKGYANYTGFGYANVDDNNDFSCYHRIDKYGYHKYYVYQEYTMWNLYIDDKYTIHITDFYVH
jgi:hypothetical protein